MKLIPVVLAAGENLQTGVSKATSGTDQLGKIGESSFLVGTAGKTGTAIYSNGVINWAALVSLVAQVLFFVAAVATFIFLIWGGLTFITSEGDSGKKAQARNRIMYAAIGMLVTACAFVLWRLILSVIGVEELTPGI